MSSILDEAKALVHGDRNNSYGHALDDFEMTAELWTAFLKNKLKEGSSITAEDSTLMMVLLKVRREGYKHKADNLVDIAGYAECLAKINMERESRAGITRAIIDLNREKLI